MIFCVEDDNNIRELIVYSLQATGFQAYGFADGTELFQALDGKFEGSAAEGGNMPELILLDIMLPDMDGLEIIAKLKEKHETSVIPIILLTAKSAEYDKVKGLDTGADDYITKPFGIMEMVARVKAVLRRAGRQADEVKAAVQNEVLRYAGIEIDLDRHEVKSNGQTVSLTLKEFELLKKLLSEPERVISRNTLLDEVWGLNFYGETRTVDAHIKTLRQKLGDCGNMIETIRGVGYKLGK